MPPRAKKKASPKRRTPSSQGAVQENLPFPETKYILVINDSPLRKKHIKTFQKTEKEISKTQELLEEYEKKAVPQYDEWYEKNFQKMVDEIRNKSEEISEKERFLAQIQYIYQKKRISFYDAYIFVTNLKKKPAEYEAYWEDIKQKEEERFYKQKKRNQSAWDEEMYFDDDFEDKESSEPFSKEELYEMFEEMISHDPKVYKRIHQDEEVFERLFQEFCDQFQREQDFQSQKKEKTQSQKENDLKTVYRKIARKLHPDYRKSNNPKLDELWHEVQSAYDRQDKEKLDSLDALADLYIDGVGSGLSISQLIAITEEIKEELSKLKKHFQKIKKTNAWQFYSGTPRKQLDIEIKIKDELQMDLRLIKHRTKEIDSILKIWSTPQKETHLKKTKPFSSRPGTRFSKHDKD